MHPGSWNEAYKTRQLQSTIVLWYKVWIFGQQRMETTRRQFAIGLTILKL